MKVSGWLLGLGMALVAPFALAADEDCRRLAGRVCLGDDPVASAVVRVTRLDPDLGALSYSKVRSVRSDDTGEFALEGLATGSYLVDACGEDCWLPLPVRVTLSAVNPGLESLEFALEPAAGIEGQVTDPDGIPLGGVRVFVGDAGLQAPLAEPVAILDHPAGRLVHLEPGLTYPRLPLAVAVTDEKGCFRLSPVVPEVETSIRIFGCPPFHDRSVNGIRVGRGKTSFIKVELSRGATIEGTVVKGGDQDGQEVRLSLFVLEGQPTRAAWNLLARSAGADTDPADRFRFPQLQEGRYVVVAESEQWARAISPVLIISSPEQVLTTELTLRIRRQITGRVVSSEGKPVLGGTVEVVAEGFLPGSVIQAIGGPRVEVKPDGTFQLPGLASPTVSLRVVCHGNPVTLMEAVPTGGEPLTLKLDRPERRFRCGP
ncbi:MAG: carboxypeptidase-like regulatory domain-containing protein [Planctomycetota bacterium]